MPDTKKQYDDRYLAKLKADPIRYKKYVDNEKKRSVERYAKLKADPVKHRKKKDNDNKNRNDKYQSDAEFRKKRIINKWKSRGIFDADFDSLYEMFIEQTNCWICQEEFKEKGDRCMDHDHSIEDAPNVRFVCCRDCNMHILKE